VSRGKVQTGRKSSFKISNLQDLGCSLIQITSQKKCIYMLNQCHKTKPVKKRILKKLMLEVVRFPASKSKWVGEPDYVGSQGGGRSRASAIEVKTV